MHVYHYYLPTMYLCTCNFLLQSVVTYNVCLKWDKRKEQLYMLYVTHQKEIRKLVTITLHVVCVWCECGGCVFTCVYHKTIMCSIYTLVLGESAKERSDIVKRSHARRNVAKKLHILTHDNLYLALKRCMYMYIHCNQLSLFDRLTIIKPLKESM